MKKCTQCGAVLDDDTKFCTNCGANVTESQMVNPVSNHQEMWNQTTDVSNGNVKKVNPTVIAIVAAIGIIIVGAAVFQLAIKPGMDQASDYKQAIAYASSGDYEQAANIFEYLGDYKDSQQKWAESKIEQAKKCLKAEDDFDTNFSKVNGIVEELEKRQQVLTADGKRKVESLKQQADNYQRVQSYIDDGSYTDARELLQKMDICPAVEEALSICNNAINGEESQSDSDYEDTNTYAASNDSDAYTASEEDDSSDFIFPDSSDEYLTHSDVENLSSKELSLARNEIYARHGRIFESEGLRDYFESMDWYDGRYEEVPDSDLSQIEREYQIDSAV